MVALRRRRLLGAVAASIPVAGCTAHPGHDPILRLRNPLPRPVEVRVTVHRRSAGEDVERTFDVVVSVGASEAMDLEVFTEDDGYHVVVERDDHSVEFRTRPICESASTSVTLRSSGLIEYRVEFCEGPTETGTSRTS